MSKKTPEPDDPVQPAKPRPFRRAVLRGLGVVMPPLLTLVLFIWAWATIDGYVLKPIENGLDQVIVFFSMQSGVQDEISAEVEADKVWVVSQDNERVPTATVMRAAGSVQGILSKAKSQGWRVASFEHGGVVFVPLVDQTWIPQTVYDEVEESPGKTIMATATAQEVYERYVKVKYLPRWRTIPVFLILFIAILYLLGRFLAAGVGRIFLTGVEGLINRLPIVRNVYSSVKQVTDFIFSEREIEFNRVVAVQYPRKGIWSIGFVTGESMLDIRSAANEPVLSVLMPTSPMPATGFTVTVRKSETIDLDITIDQAIQFIVSCGVVVPSQQQPDEVSVKLSNAIARRLQAESSEPDPLAMRQLPPHRALADASRNGDDTALEPDSPSESSLPPESQESE